MRLSNQAIGVLMVTLQKCILEQTSIVEILQNYNFQFNEVDETISITNPPDRLEVAESSEASSLEQKSTVGSD